MEKLALTLPGMSKQIPCAEGSLFCSTEKSSLGYILTQFYSLAIYLAAFLLFIWFAWGVFEYIFAGGNKDKLGKAKNRIIYAVVGFILIILAYTIGEYLKTIFPQVNQFYG